MSILYRVRTALHLTGNGTSIRSRIHGDLFADIGEISDAPLITFGFRLNDFRLMKRLKNCRGVYLKNINGEAAVLLIFRRRKKIFLLPKRKHRSVYMEFTGEIGNGGGFLVHISYFYVKPL